jgi:hypothetical protein
MNHLVIVPKYKFEDEDMYNLSYIENIVQYEI